MSEKPEMVKCDWCGKMVEAVPAVFCETGFDAVYQPEEGEEWKEPEIATLPEGHSLTPEHRERLKAEMQLDDAQLDQLLTTGTVDGLGGVVCLQCQDESIKQFEAGQ